jgi:hypothetical protein
MLVPHPTMTGSEDSPARSNPTNWCFDTGKEKLYKDSFNLEKLGQIVVDGNNLNRVKTMYSGHPRQPKKRAVVEEDPKIVLWHRNRGICRWSLFKGCR